MGILILILHGMAVRMKLDPLGKGSGAGHLLGTQRPAATILELLQASLPFVAGTSSSGLIYTVPSSQGVGGGVLLNGKKIQAVREAQSKQLDEITVRISEMTRRRILGLHMEHSGGGAHCLLFVPPCCCRG